MERTYNASVTSPKHAYTMDLLRLRRSRHYTSILALLPTRRTRLSLKKAYESCICGLSVVELSSHGPLHMYCVHLLPPSRTFSPALLSASLLQRGPSNGVNTSHTYRITLHIFFPASLYKVTPSQDLYTNRADDMCTACACTLVKACMLRARGLRRAWTMHTAARVDAITFRSTHAHT